MSVVSSVSRGAAYRTAAAALLLIASTCGTPSHEPKTPPDPGVEATSAAGLRAAYLAAVQADAGAEYAFRSSAPQPVAKNPVQGLLSAAAPTGMHVTPAATAAAGTPVTAARAATERSLNLALIGFGCDAALPPLAPIAPTAHANRVEYTRPEVTEWYVNGPLGLEQGFTVPRQPAAECARGQSLRLDISVGDAVVPTLRGSGDDDTSLVELRDRAGELWLRYSDMYAADARHTPLPVHLAVVDGHIRLSVDAAHAAYPITIDPLVWTLQQQLQGSDTAANDLFGRPVAISGSTAVVGAFAATLPGKSGAGAAYVFVRAGSAWTQQQKLTASDAAADAAFGYAVAVAGDTAIVGAPGATSGGKSGAGAAYVFTRSGMTWTQQQRLAAADAATDDNLGDSVTIDGDTVVVGADYADGAGTADSGAAYVFTRTGTTWSPQQKLSASDGSDSDHLGQVVSLSGNSVVLGAPYADQAGKTSAGAAYVFTRTGTTWSQQQKLAASDAAVGDSLGSAVALGGNTLFVGAPNADVGGKADAGAAYVFTRTGATWTQAQKLVADTPAAADTFGDALAFAGSNALVGADGKSGGGSVYVFNLAGATWSQQQVLVSPLVGADGAFGRSLAIDGSYAVAGAPFSTVAGKDSAGVAFVLVLGMPKPNGQGCLSAAECTSGFCVDSVCCNSTCGSGVVDCQACSVAAGAATDGTCAPAKSGAVCRPAVSACDGAETCDGIKTTCPSDVVMPSTTLCRSATGLCDVAEFCTGSDATCPPDNLKPIGSECRSAIGACDLAETCTGTSTNCPADTFKPNTAECRSAAGICDVADFCTGTGAGCPSDQFKPSTTPCRAAADLCDAVELCTGTSAACPADGLLKAGSECRKAAGPCDAAEACTGGSAACPTDTFKTNTAVCRAAADVCDNAEFCSGASVDCPADQFKPSSAQCRSAAGACDVAEFCSGGSPACPKDDFQPSTTLCRAATGACDVAEQCTGTGAACPQDAAQANGTSCSGGSCQAGQCRQVADLSITLTPGAPTTSERVPVALQAVVVNLSATPASGIKVQVEVPQGASLESSTGDGLDLPVGRQRHELRAGAASLRPGAGAGAPGGAAQGRVDVHRDHAGGGGGV